MKLIKKENDELWDILFLIKDEQHIGCALVSLEGKWLKVNNTLCNIVEYSASELLNTTYHAITHISDIKPDEDEIRSLIVKKTHIYSLRKRYITKTNNVVWVCLTVIPVFDESDNVSFFLSIIVPINFIPDKAINAISSKQVDFLSLIKNNIQAFVLTCLTSVSILVTLGVTFYTTVETVNNLKIEAEQQRALIIKILEGKNE